MFTKTIFKVLAVVLLLPVVSCKKWLDLQPQDGLTGAEYWKTKEQVSAAVTGIYASLTGSATGSRSAAESFFLWGELRADMVTSTLATTAEQVDVINVNILPTNSIASWRGIYETINYCNTVIDFAPGVLAKDATFTQAALDKAIAEAKAVRALMYFYLVRTFDQVPLKLKSTSSDQDIVSLPKSSQDEVLTQALKDLSEAETFAVTDYGDRASNKGRITKATINAIQADIYLWQEKYTECVAACNKVINTNQFGLIDGTDANIWYRTLYVNGNSNESLFELQFDNQKLNPFYTIFNTTQKKFLASSIVMDEIYTVDFTDPLKFDIRADGAAVRSTDQLIWKYIGLTNTTARAQEESYAHWIMYRYADVLLMKAEAQNQLGNGQEALNIIALIRARARALIATAANPAPNDKVAIADYILKERSREFAFEGKRWYDILRNARRNNYQRLDLLLDMVAGTVPPNRQQSAIAKFKDKNCHYLPIYTYELTTNKALVQNPFYK
ncbi:RagB/SusD family nutrient uptake outer membrane protein [Ferruginibacter sp. SUN106]|uniref:RagB/SusD family nutrient uptake outer membrane protein n=1 Tax=Ferruginibacter sp. SUN106 TaxID=2978348 RepID=UPI003D36562D